MKYFVILFICYLPTVLHAQSSIDLFTISGFYGSPAAYEKPLDGEATESGMLLNLKIPVVCNTKTTWYNDFTYTQHSVKTDLDPEPSDMITSMKLHAFIFQTGIVRKIDEQNGFQLLFVPRYTTDFQGSDRKHWQLGAVGLYEHRFSQRLLMRFGVLYNGELFGPLLVPLIFIDWQLSNRWSITGLLPINLKVNYKITERFSTGINHFGFITTYQINEAEFKGDYIERNSIDESLFVRWKMVGNLHIEARFGYSLNRVYAQYKEDQKMDLRLSLVGFGDDRVQENVNFNSGPITSLRLVYNLPLNSTDEK
jgi:hypothetical protein